MQQLRKSIQVKFDPHMYKEALNKYFKEYAEIVNYSLTYVYNVYSQYSRLQETTEGICSACNTEKTLTHRHKTGLVCTQCFRRAYSEYTLRKTLIPILKEKLPEFSVYATLYHSTLRHIFGIFKSWVNKQEQREKDRKQIQIEFEEALKSGEADFSVSWRPGLPGDQEELQIDWSYGKLKRMNRVKKDIKLPQFRGTTIRMWKGFAGITEDFLVWLKNPKIRETIGRYTTYTGDYQVKHIEEILDNLGDKYLSIHKKDGKFFLDVPYVKEVELMNDEEILEMSKKPTTTTCIVTFGIKEPALVSVYQDNKLIERKPFGDSTLWTKKQKLKEIDKKVLKKISKRHDKQRARIQKKKWWKKTRNKRMNYIKDYDNNLTYQIAEYIRKFTDPVVVMRNNKTIKNIEYKGKLKKELMSWSVIQEQLMLEYKLNFMGISVYWIPYRELNEFTCPKCGNKIGKVLTMKLKFDQKVECECGFTEYLNIMDSNNIITKFQSHQPKNSEGSPELKSPC